MGRILAIDYGTKRVGLAVTDPEKMIATPLQTIETPFALRFVSDYAMANNVEKIIIGYPTDLQGNPTHATKYVEGFISKLKEKLPAVELIKWDEAYTSKEAMKTLIDSGIRKKERRKKELLDSVAAAIILQEYLQNI